MTSVAKTLDDELIQALRGEMTPKFLATRDASGKPNVVPIVSLDAADERTLIFAELFIWKTKANLAADPRICAALATDDLRVWTIRGRFREFVDGGPHVEQMNRKEIFRYNAYLGVTRVAVIDVEAVTGVWRFSKLGVAADVLPRKLLSRLVGRRGANALPPRVAEKFDRTRAVKVLAYLGPQGHPEIVPAFSLLPTRSATMLLGVGRSVAALRDLPADTQVAAAVITTDPIAYQIKGVYTGHRLTPIGRVARIQVQEVYSASPPLAGERIELAATANRDPSPRPIGPRPS